LKSARDHAWDSDLSRKSQHTKEGNVKHEYEEKFGGLGAEAYLAEVIRRYGGLVRHICRNALGNRPEDIDECVSDSFVALWEKAKGGGYDQDAGDVKQYLCGIARNKAIDRYRKLAARPVTLPLNDADGGAAAAPGTLAEPDIAELFAQGDDEALMIEAVGNLPSPGREIFVLRYYYLERVKAIAEKLGLTEKAVQDQLYRGKLSLRRRLAGGGLGDELGDEPSTQGRRDKKFTREVQAEGCSAESRPQESRVESYSNKNHSNEDCEVIIYG
jgi:RNA polymerase sigma-70 factor (ECF subfamily)